MFVIPMAGMSSRFFEAGYEQPKYRLPLGADTLFAVAVRSFEAYFSEESFLFVTLARFDAADFVRSECARLGIVHADVVTLEEATQGQAETVARGLMASAVGDGPITIFNIDTALPGFRHPDFGTVCDGFLDVFIGSGPNWSYVRPVDGSASRVAETAEKREISNLCSTGLYHFASSEVFLAAYDEAVMKGPAQLDSGEVYVAPLYNRLIADGKDVRYRVVATEDVRFFGTPREYEDLLATNPAR